MVPVMVWATGMLLKVPGRWDTIDILRAKIVSWVSLENIWIKAHFPRERLFGDFG